MGKKSKKAKHNKEASFDSPAFVLCANEEEALYPQLVEKVASTADMLVGFSDSDLAMRAFADIEHYIEAAKRMLTLKSSWRDNRVSGDAKQTFRPEIVEVRNLAAKRSYTILKVLDERSDRRISMRTIELALKYAGVPLERASLNTRLNRWKNPTAYQQSRKSPPPAYVTWDDPNNRILTDAGRNELSRLAARLAEDERAHLDAAANAAIADAGEII
ncbi:MAG: hypothetical protein AAGJ87_09085 [Pseudomonadota bacterium]